MTVSGLNERTKALKIPLMRTAVFCLFGLVLVWLVLSRSFAAYFADNAPSTALLLKSKQPEALVNKADRALNSPPIEQSAKPHNDAAEVSNARDIQGPEYLNNAFESVAQYRSIDLASVRAWAEAALMKEPLNARALRILGQVADATKDKTDALKFMRAAARLSLHESDANFWLLQKSAEVKDYNAIIYYADVLLRSEPQFGKFVVPFLALTTKDATSSHALKSVLASDPPWREEFFRILPDAVTDARVPLDLLNSLRTTGTPPSPADIEPYLQALIAHKLYDLAYYTWLQFLPVDELRRTGLLFNGSFEIKPSGLPFDWVIKPGSGVTIDIVPRSDSRGEHALLVAFDYGRVDYQSIQQMVVLSPGSYQFVAKYKGELIGPRGLRWRVFCAESTTKPIGESPMINGIASTWRDVGFTFTVPAADCRGQYVRLDLDARMASEKLVSGSIMFDELRLSRSVVAQASGGNAEHQPDGGGVR